MRGRKGFIGVVLALVAISVIIGAGAFLVMLANGGTPSGKGVELDVITAKTTPHVIFGENQQRPQNLTKIQAKEGVFILRNKYDFIGKWKNGYKFYRVDGTGFAAQKFVCAKLESKPRKCLKVVNK